MRDTSTKFPNQIDSRTFFSDIDLSQVPIMKNYYTLQNAGNYTRASELLNNSEVFFYGAWWLNMMENRLNAIVDYALNKMEKPDLVRYTNTEPTNIPEGMNWVEYE